jgi:hypothetical protein
MPIILRAIGEREIPSTTPSPTLLPRPLSTIAIHMLTCSGRVRLLIYAHEEFSDLRFSWKNDSSGSVEKIKLSEENFGACEEFPTHGENRSD